MKVCKGIRVFKTGKQLVLHKQLQEGKKKRSSGNKCWKSSNKSCLERWNANYSAWGFLFLSSQGQYCKPNKMDCKLGRKEKKRSDQSWLSTQWQERKRKLVGYIQYIQDTQWKHSNLLLMMQQCVTFTSSNGQTLLATQV
jgi:hypothetical protein